MSIVIRFRWIYAILILLMMQSSIQAQETVTLTLDECIEYAFENNPSYKMAQKEAGKARAAVWEAYSNVLPQVNLSANFQHAWELQTNKVPNFLKPMLAPLGPLIPGLDQMPDFVEFAFGLENTLNYGAYLTQPLFLGGAGLAGIQIAYSGTNAAQLNLEEERQSLIYQTAIAFNSCVLTKELIKVQEEAFAQAQANFDIVRKKYDVGSASGFDKMRAEVELANLMPDLINARNSYRLALTQLKMLIGIEKEASIDVQGALTYVEDDFGKLSLEDVERLAFQNRPLIKMIDHQKNISRKAVSIARSNFLPKLFFATDYSFLDMRNNYKFNTNESSKGFTSALSLQIPLFQGFKSSAQFQKAKLDYHIVLDTEKQVYDAVNAEVEVAFNSFQEARQKFESSVKTVELANEALRLANLLYDEGANTQLDVLNSQLALTRSKLSYINSVFEYQNARYQLRKVAGELNGNLR